MTVDRAVPENKDIPCIAEDSSSDVRIEVDWLSAWTVVLYANIVTFPPVLGSRCDLKSVQYSSRKRYPLKWLILVLTVQYGSKGRCFNKSFSVSAAILDPSVNHLMWIGLRSLGTAVNGYPEVILIVSWTPRCARKMHVLVADLC